MSPQSTPPSPPPAQQQPFMVQVSPAPAESQNIGQTIVGAFGLTGALILGAVISGTTLAGLWIVWRKWRRTYDTDAPPSMGPMPMSPEPPATRPRSSQDQ